VTPDREPVSPDEPNRILLSITYPAFRFTILTAGAQGQRRRPGTP